MECWLPFVPLVLLGIKFTEFFRQLYLWYYHLHIPGKGFALIGHGVLPFANPAGDDSRAVVISKVLGHATSAFYLRMVRWLVEVYFCAYL